MTNPAQIASTAEIRRRNYENVYSYIYENKRTSKQTITLALNLSLPTVSQNLKQLETAGLIQREGFFASTGGRKAQMISCVRDARISIGMAILKESIHLCAIDMYANILAEEERSLPFTNEEVYYRSVGEWVNGFASALPYKKEQILGIGIAIQGLVSADGEAVVYGPILNNTGTTREMFQEWLHHPCILIHDTEASAIAELHRNPDLEDAFFLVLNKNLGGVLLLNRTIYHGALRTDGTIEHMTIHPGGSPCYCGKKGCMEAYCSADSLKQRSSLPFDLFFQFVRAGEAKCTAIWEAYLHDLALSIDNMRMLANCPFVLSGFLLQYLTDEDLAKLTAYVRQNSAFPDMEAKIVRGRIHRHSASLGAALHYINDFLTRLAPPGTA